MTIKKTSKNIRQLKNSKNIRQYKNKNINYNLKLTKKKENIQKGGKLKEKFEIKPLSDFDYDKYRLSNYMNTDIDWGLLPGSPPMPNCSIL